MLASAIHQHESVLGMCMSPPSWTCLPPPTPSHSSRLSLLLLLSRFSCVQLCVTPQTAAHQAPPSLGFSRQEHWNGLPFPSPLGCYSRVFFMVRSSLTSPCLLPLTLLLSSAAWKDPHDYIRALQLIQDNLSKSADWKPPFHLQSRFPALCRSCLIK